MDMLPINDFTLFELAQKQREFAYAPYSNYKVGCVVYAPGGDNCFFFGSNVENSSFGLTICAERVALFNWVRFYPKFPIQKLVFATQSEGHFSPCGACLQVMLEFMSPDAAIIHHNGKNWMEYKLSDLIPHANPHILDKSNK